MLSYNEIKERKYILFKGEPYEVLSSHVSRKQANKPVNKTKLKSLRTGRVIEHTFHMSDKVDEVEIEKRFIVYIYSKGNEEHWFHEMENKSARFPLSQEIVGNTIQYIKSGDKVEALIYNDGNEEFIIGLKLPIKVEMKVTEAPPSIRGNTSSGGSKVVKTDTGMSVTVPLFIKEGDIILVNTESGEYVERISKS